MADQRTNQVSGLTNPLHNPEGGYAIGVIDHGFGPPPPFGGDGWFHVDARTFGTVTNHSPIKVDAGDVNIGQLNGHSVVQVRASGVVKVESIAEGSVLQVASKAAKIVVVAPIPDGSAVEYIEGTAIEAGPVGLLFPKPPGYWG